MDDSDLKLGYTFNLKLPLGYLASNGVPQALDEQHNKRYYGIVFVLVCNRRWP